MAKLEISYEPGTVPQISVQLETASGRKRVVGQVDSGSDRSLCPLVFAEELGLQDDLERDEKMGEPAIGGTFDLWTPRKMAINAQIVLPDLNEGDFVPWGPLFSLRPAFAEAETLLLGQADFFAAFDVKFLNRNGGSMLEICECPRSLQGP